MGRVPLTNRAIGLVMKSEEKRRHRESLTKTRKKDKEEKEESETLQRDKHLKKPLGEKGRETLDRHRQLRKPSPRTPFQAPWELPYPADASPAPFPFA
jgi:DNA primase large subunit